MRRSAAASMAVLSWAWNTLGVDGSTVVPFVAQEPVTSPVTAAERVTSVASGFRSEIRRRWPVLMSQVRGLPAGTSGFRPRAYFRRLGMPSLVAMAVSEAVPLLAIVPNLLKY